MLYPISFSVPEEIVVPYVPFKTCHTATHAYQFTKPEPYLKNYRSAIFGTTCLKCGWDAFRHYEILSQGTIPNFENLQGCPKQTLHSFPKATVQRLMDTYLHLSFDEIMKTSSSTLYNELDSLLTYTRDHLTTRSAANTILSKTSTPTTRKILFLHNTQDLNDYLSIMTAHGLLRSTEGSVDIYPEFPYLYDDYPVENTLQLYGKGFNYTRHLPAHYKKSLELDSIWKKIQAREYEHIIISVHCKLDAPIPFLAHGQGQEKHLFRYYEPREISLLCGRDCDPYYDPTISPTREWWIRMNHTCPLTQHSGSFNVFVRELGD